VKGARAAPALPRGLAGDGRGNGKRAGGAGDRVGAPEERRTAFHGWPPTPARPPGLMVQEVAVRDEAGACAGGAVRRSACGADLRGELAVRTVAAVTDELAAGSTAAPTTEELGVDAVGARAAPAQPRQLVEEGGVCVSELGGNLPSCREARSREGGREGCRPTEDGACAGGW
jgi:hypothetical protein